MAKARVSSLINPDLSMWKSEEVNQLFFPHEASLVLGNPLSHRKPLVMSLGLVLHPGSSTLVVLTSYWLPRPQLIVQALPIKLISVVSGKGFGSYRYPTR